MPPNASNILWINALLKSSSKISIDYRNRSVDINHIVNDGKRTYIMKYDLGGKLGFAQ
jgi:hypothetical protein